MSSWLACCAAAAAARVALHNYAMRWRFASFMLPAALCGLSLSSSDLHIYADTHTSKCVCVCGGEGGGTLRMRRVCCVCAMNIAY